MNLRKRNIKYLPKMTLRSDKQKKNKVMKE